LRQGDEEWPNVEEGVDQVWVDKVEDFELDKFELQATLCTM